jgi:hypothetical protein
MAYVQNNVEVKFNVDLELSNYVCCLNYADGFYNVEFL